MVTGFTSMGPYIQADECLQSTTAVRFAEIIKLPVYESDIFVRRDRFAQATDSRRT
jgi:hypothetical protein